MDFVLVNISFFIAVAIVFVLVLTAYAAKLLLQLKRQQNQIQSIKQSRLDNIWTSITTISEATLQQQCTVSEATIRIKGLIEASPDLQDRFGENLPVLSKFYKEIEHHPILNNRKNTPKDIIKKLDGEREELEFRYENQILKELEWLKGQKLVG